jgi:hypothetical protein
MHEHATVFYYGAGGYVDGVLLYVVLLGYTITPAVLLESITAVRDDT